MSFLVDCIICECGDEFISEQDLQKHLENDHGIKNKKPAPEVCDWDKQLSRDDLQVDTNVCLESSKNNPLKTISAKSPITYSQHENVSKTIKIDKGLSKITIKTIKIEPAEQEQEQGSVVNIKNELNEELTLTFEEIFANEMVLSHEEVVDNKDCSPIAIKLEMPTGVEQVEYNDSYSSEQILKNNFSEERTENEPKICSLCQRVFSNERSMWIHYTKSHKERRSDNKKQKATVLKNRICEVCGKAFASVASLTYHQRIHTGERPYLCSYCNKGFTMPLLLQIHVRTHTGERPYQCPHCPKAFGNKAAINRHNRVHTGEKPYPCPKCGKTFTQSNSMKLHVKTVHLKHPAPYKSKKRIEAELQRNRILHTYVRTMKRAVFKQKKGYMSVYSTLT